MFRVALLGNTAAQAERLTRQLPFPHEIVTAANLGNARLDVMVSLRFGEAEARMQPRLLHMPGAGIDGVDFALLPPDCSLCNVFEHEGPIAEYVLLAMLDWEIGYSAMTRSFSAENWSQAYRERRPHGEIGGKTLGLIGFGHIGQTIAQRASAFGMHVVAVASHARPAPAPLAWIGGAERLDELMSSSDYIVIACPLSEATRGLVGPGQIAAMRSTAVLINIARGEIVDEAALYDALDNRRIGGAVLDAWFRYPGPGEDVPPSRFAFDALSNVRCTPHASAWTSALFERRYKIIAENIRRFHEGEPLLNLVRAPVAAQAGGV